MKEKNMHVLIMDMGSDMRGESPLTGHEGKIELLSFSHGLAMQMTGDISSAERTSGKPNHQDMTVTKYLDATSPLLNQGCCEGKLFPQVEIIIGRDDSGKVTELMRYTIRNVLISSVSVGGGGGGDRPVETVTLNYNKISWRFTSQKFVAGKDETVEGKWDLAKNAAK
jgi:type VI secretion system secreted protein Hcp